MDYYKILGIGKDCSLEELKAAFRTKSKLYHPDLNKTDSEAAERFIKIKEAYDYLNTKIRTASDKKSGENNRNGQKKDKKSTKPLYQEFKYYGKISLTKNGMDKGNYHFNFHDPKEDKNYTLYIKESVQEGELVELVLWEQLDSKGLYLKLPIKRIFYIRIEKKKDTIKSMLNEHSHFLFVLTIIAIFSYFVFFVLSTSNNTDANNNHQIQAVIIEKNVIENNEYLIYKNLTNNDYYRVNDALQFWNNKVGDTVFVKFKQKRSEQPVYLSIKKK